MSEYESSVTANRNASANLPYYTQGEVVRGFGRGGKELGCPTANFAESVIPEKLDCGVYYGFASVDGGPVHKSVLSVGWNPFYHNTVKSLETHILHEFEQDFYGSHLKLVITGYIRPMLDNQFNSLEELKEAIANDINVAKMKLTEEAHMKYRNDSHFIASC